MTRSIDGQSAALEQALAGGAPQRVGSFRFYFADQRWEWSEQVHQLHGYEPGSVTPTTELVLSHKHPDDRAQVAATIDDILHTQQAFGARHRIIDTAGNVHHVVVVSDRLYDGRGVLIGTHGYYVEVATHPDEDRDEDLVTARLSEITENRAAIEQAKGMLMLAYGLEQEAAFNVLKLLSQEANVKLRLLAEQICRDFRDADRPISPSAQLDRLLLTAHRRVAGRPGNGEVSLDRGT
ncbi:antitermination regulator [Mycobacterium kansasii]|uniref:ANTAR domain-containing protein n=1 Tax=Mycobacterium innocens TaxID=2341083 RepID=A0A498Q6T1_9MYCO|nr:MULTISPECIES: PAS and ANTAR domain-containing protein [Mycobacterium]KZS57240.1 antitermination regulator [Mycobacterium kansasii]VBA40095.1 hypothetical protein LAUMK13_02902 [Mycobacterium innocens]